MRFSSVVKAIGKGICTYDYRLRARGQIDNNQVHSVESYMLCDRMGVVGLVYNLSKEGLKGGGVGDLYRGSLYQSQLPGDQGCLSV